MAGSIFAHIPGGGGSIVDQARRVVGNDPMGFYERAYREIPEFRDIANSVRGKTPEEALSMYSGVIGRNGGRRP